MIVPTFLYIDPLKQGLKHPCPRRPHKFEWLFLYIDPLKQGLKPSESGLKLL